ncbi:uncharacterized protein LOC115450398 [Manduca sexta]|uniref:uncharacterized protein LOC115450398 n=1 Tax=Manduca sexta TaxID=7130 RepID=UPI0011828D74|nr:uncharacterized protein LOC115450398 [Manduca sexta]
MDNFIDAVVDFIRVRQLNIAVAVVLTVMYLLYQYWGVLYKWQEDEHCRHARLSRSRSRSCSRSRSRSGEHHYKTMDSKHGRRSRKMQRRCPDCSMCHVEQ